MRGEGGGGVGWWGRGGWVRGGVLGCVGGGVGGGRGGGGGVGGWNIMGCLPPDLFVCMRAGCSERETATSCATQDNIRKKIRITLQNLLIYT